MRDRDSRRVAYIALLAFTVLVAAVTFVLSFSGLDDYGRRVAHLGDLSPLVPIGVDGLTLCAVAATFILRDAPLRVRLYAWCVFGVAVAASVAGNLSHAEARSLSWKGMVGAAAWPILLALASHMVIVVRRHMHPTRPPVAQSQQEPAVAVASAPVAPSAAEPATAPVKRSPKSARRKAAGTGKTDPKVIAEARRRHAAGDKVPQVAAALGVHKASVYRWVGEQPLPAVNGHPVAATDPEGATR